MHEVWKRFAVLCPTLNFDVAVVAVATAVTFNLFI